MRSLNPPVLNGSWEKPGKSPIAAAFTVLILCGALYSVVGSAAVSLVTLVAAALDDSWSLRGGFFEMLSDFYARFQVSILSVTAVMEFALLLGLPLMLARRWHTREVGRYCRYARPRALDLVLAGSSALAVVPVADLLNRWAYVLFPVLREAGSGEASLLFADSPPRLILVIACIAVTPAVCEEALFRGYFLTTLSRKLSPFVSICVSGILFALFHMSPLSIAALMFVGFYLGFLMERMKTIYASMLAHFLYNLAAILLFNCAPDWPWLVDSNGDMSLPLILMCGALFALLVATIWVRGTGRERPFAERGYGESSAREGGPIGPT